MDLHLIVSKPDCQVGKQQVSPHPDLKNYCKSNVHLLLLKWHMPAGTSCANACHLSKHCHTFRMACTRKKKNPLVLPWTATPIFGILATLHSLETQNVQYSKSYFNDPGKKTCTDSFPFYFTDCTGNNICAGHPPVKTTLHQCVANCVCIWGWYLGSAKKRGWGKAHHEYRCCRR